MTRPIPFTQASIQRAMKAARKEGLRLVIQVDGSMTFVRDERPQERDEPLLEPKAEVVL